ncbi:hypothetical protein [Candidatus Cyanaurora vandensis]|nr:hypothetical protein [Candidatus Cyanaurora vandensis]
MDPKKSYIAPKVARLGGLTDLTQAMNTGSMFDSMAMTTAS